MVDDSEDFAVIMYLDLNAEKKYYKKIKINFKRASYRIRREGKARVLI
jgi:hypothetical protein